MTATDDGRAAQAPAADLPRQMRTHLRRFPRQCVEDPALRPAAVAIVVVLGGASGPGFLVTRRGGRLRSHSGQWALPGGRVDPGESVVDTARRELDEELGLRLDAGRVVGQLDDYPTRSGYRITPVVMWTESAEDLAPNPDEVASVHHIPLADLDRPEVPHLERIQESDRPVLSIPFASLGHRIYAPTAAMIYQFREVALHGRSTRVREFDQPLFAWR
jgi:8-oxo-dGTP pyrophosphatase MutT (NUDIX family)